MDLQRLPGILVSQMQPDKLSCGSDNLPGPLVVVLVVETVNTLRMIDEGQGGVFGQCFGHKAIDRIKHRWNFIVPGAGNEHWRDFARIGLQVSDRRKDLIVSGFSVLR